MDTSEEMFREAAILKMRQQKKNSWSRQLKSVSEPINLIKRTKPRQGSKKVLQSSADGGGEETNEHFI